MHIKNVSFYLPDNTFTGSIIIKSIFLFIRISLVLVWFVKKTKTNNTQLKQILIYARQFYNVMMATYLYGQNLKYRCFILKPQQPMHVIDVVTVAADKWAKILP